MSDRFEILATPLSGLKVLQRKVMRDTRGYLERLYCAQELGTMLSGRGIVQINHSLTARCGTVRGMHYQRPPHAELKFVSCIRGEVFDVAVDLRCDSPTFLRWHAETLSDNNYRTLLIPEGFAHGFQALSDNCELLYFHTASYAPASEAGINPRDPMLALVWPAEITEVSERDDAQPMLNGDFGGIAL